MAKVIKPERADSVFPKHERYPWEQWFDGQLWELTKGADFKTEPASFRSAAFLQAKRRDIKLRTRVVGDKFYLQALTNGAT